MLYPLSYGGLTMRSENGPTGEDADVAPGTAKHCSRSAALSAPGASSTTATRRF